MTDTFKALIIGGIIVTLAVVGIVIYATGTHYSAADGKYLADIHASGTGAPVEAARVPNATLLAAGHAFCKAIPDNGFQSTIDYTDQQENLDGVPTNLGAAIPVNAVYDLCPQYIGPLNSWIKAGQP